MSVIKLHHRGNEKQIPTIITLSYVAIHYKGGKDDYFAWIIWKIARFYTSLKKLEPGINEA